MKKKEEMYECCTYWEDSMACIRHSNKPCECTQTLLNIFALQKNK